MNTTRQRSTEKTTIHRRAPLTIHAFQVLQERIRPRLWRQPQAALVAKTRPAAQLIDLAHQQHDGFAMLDGLIDADWVQRVRASLETRLCQGRWRRELGMFRHDAMPPESHVADMDDVVDIPEVLALANHPRVLGVVGAYLGCQPTIDSIMAWWSLPGHDQAENEQFYHRDNDSIRFLKLFIYLSDVGPDCGPHVHVRDSHAQDSSYERRRHQDAEVKFTLSDDNAQTVLRPAAAVLRENSSCLNRDAASTGQFCLLLQIKDTLVPPLFYF